MTPNLFVLTKTAFSPHKWFASSRTSSHSSSEQKSRSKSVAPEIEHWQHPVPGYYQHEAGRGWYLIARDGSFHGSQRVDPAVKVAYSKVLKRWLFETDMQARKVRGRFAAADSPQTHDVGFFRLDDGVAWVNNADAEGQFLPGPYTLYCYDDERKAFRVMKRRDDPIRQARKGRAERRPSQIDRARQSSSSSGGSDDMAEQYRRESCACGRDRERHGSPATTFVNSKTSSIEPGPSARFTPKSHGAEKAAACPVDD